MWACRDALFDPHNEPVSLIKSTLKGAILGGITGTILTLLFKKYPTFVMKKAMRYINKTNFGNTMYSIQKWERIFILNYFEY